jgi:hypothetical protein
MTMGTMTGMTRRMTTGTTTTRTTTLATDQPPPAVEAVRSIVGLPRGGGVAGCYYYGRRRRRRARIGGRRRQSAGVVGTAPPRPPPGSLDGKEGAPLGNNDTRNDADAAAFTGPSRDEDNVIDNEEEECKTMEGQCDTQSRRRGGEEEEGRVGGWIFRLCAAVPSPPPLIPWRVLLASAVGCQDADSAAKQLRVQLHGVTTGAATRS